MAEKMYNNTFTNKVCMYLNEFEINNAFLITCFIQKDFYSRNAPIIQCSYEVDRVNSVKILDIINSGKELKAKIRIDCFDKDGKSRFLYEASDYDVLVGSIPLDSDDKLENSNESNAISSSSKFSFGLIKKVHLEGFQKGTINDFFTGMTPSAGLIYAFNKCCSSPKLKFAPMPIQSTFSGDLFCPPMSFFQFVDYLEAEYGFYDTPWNTFLDDTDIMYILDKSPRKMDIGKPHNIQLSLTGEVAITSGYIHNSPDKLEDLLIDRKDFAMVSNDIMLSDVQIATHPSLGKPSEPTGGDTRGFIYHPTTSKQRLGRKKIKIERIEFRTSSPVKIYPYTEIVIPDKRFVNKTYKPESFTQVITKEKMKTRITAFRSAYL